MKEVRKSDNKYSKKVIVPSFGMVTINFFGKSEKVIDLYSDTDEFNRQRNIKHLGLISLVFDSVSHTRFDYVMLQCMMVDVIDKFQNSESLFNPGSITINGKKEFGVSILKSWFLLSNFGHTKNTIGDEKTLAYLLLKDRNIRKKLISKIKDVTLKRYAKKVIDSFDYMSIHHLLGIARIYEEVSANNLKRELIELYKLLLLDENDLNIRCNFERLSQLRSIYNTIRDLAIITIDSHYSHYPFTINLLSSLVNLNNQDNYESDFLSSILGALNKDLYLNSNVLCLQQSYITKSLSVMEAPINLDELLFKDIFQSGILPEFNNDLKTLTRITLTERMIDSAGIQKYIKKLNREINSDNVYINIDENKYSNEIYIDFFVKKSMSINMYPNILYNILRYLESVLKDMLLINNIDTLAIAKKLDGLKEEFELTEEEMTKIQSVVLEPVLKFVDIAIKDIKKLFEQVFWDILSNFLKDNFKIVVNKDNLKNNHFGVKFLNLSLNHNQNQYLEVAKVGLDTDSGRLHEIGHLEYSLKRKYSGYVLYLIERATIFDMLQPPSKRKTTDIDSLVMKINEYGLIIEFNESKDTGQAENRAFQDLRKKFVKTLNKNAKGYKTIRVKKYGAKVVIKIKTID